MLEIRQRAGYLFLAVMLGHILLISAQVNSRSGVPILEAVTFGAFAEVQRAASRPVQRRRQRLGRLRRPAAGAGRERVAEAAAGGDCRSRCRSSGRWPIGRATSSSCSSSAIGSTLQTTAAEVIARRRRRRISGPLTIDKGTGQGLRADMAVIAPAGVVGRIVTPSRRASKVQLLIDRNAAAGALIERTRAQGVVVGGGDHRLRMEYVSEVSDIAVGDVVVTSGIDGIYPEGVRHRPGRDRRRRTVRPTARSRCGRRSTSRASRKCWWC